MPEARWAIEWKKENGTSETKSRGWGRVFFLKRKNDSAAQDGTEPRYLKGHMISRQVTTQAKSPWMYDGRRGWHTCTAQKKLWKISLSSARRNFRDRGD